MLYGHGDDGYQYGKAILADFSTNVWWGGEPVGLKEHVFQQWKTINRYPEVLAESFRKEVSEWHQLRPEQVLACNGTAEAIYLLAHIFERQRTAIAIPTFAEYEDACRLHHHQLTFVDWEKMMDSEALGTELMDIELVFICNPNNPTGAVLHSQQIESLLWRYPQTVFVVDEAYIAFTWAVESVVSLLAHCPNLVILRSLTKTFAIPGLRLGYVLASDAIIEKMEQVKYPWSVNTLAIEAGKFIIRNYPPVQPFLQILLAEKERFVSQLKQLPGLQIGESQTHYFLVESLDMPASELKKHLIDNYGILIRDAGNFRSLSPRHFRLATLSPEKNALLLKAMS
ncbi:MAG: threonine-phosphate decarboxylase [Bacteroidota bacterium]